MLSHENKKAYTHHKIQFTIEKNVKKREDMKFIKHTWCLQKALCNKHPCKYLLRSNGRARIPWRCRFEPSSEWKNTNFVSKSRQNNKMGSIACRQAGLVARPYNFVCNLVQSCQICMILQNFSLAKLTSLQKSMLQSTQMKIIAGIWVSWSGRWLNMVTKKLQNCCKLTQLCFVLFFCTLILW